MKEYINKLIQSSKDIFIGQLLIKLVTIVSIPLLTRIFKPASFGKLDIIDTMMYLLSGIMILGTDSAIGYYYFSDEKNRRKYINTSFTLRLLSGAIWVLIITMFSRYLGKLVEVDPEIIIYAMATASLIAITQFISDLLRFNYMNKINMLITGIISIVLVFSNVICGYIGGLEYLIKFRFINYLFFVVIMIIIYSSKFRFELQLKYVKKVLSYGIPLLPMTLLFWLMSYLDRYFLMYITNYEQVGLYSVGARIARYAGFLLSPIIMAWGPVSMNISKKEYSAKFYIAVMNVFMFFGITIALIFTTFARITIQLLTPTEYHYGHHIIGLLAAGFVFNNAYFISNIGISLSKKTIYTTLAAFYGVAINVIGNIFLIPILGIEGAALSTLLSFLVMFIVSTHYSKAKAGIVFFNKELYLIIIFGLISLITANFIRMENIQIETVYKSIITLSYIMLIFLFKLVNIKKIWRLLCAD